MADEIILKKVKIRKISRTDLKRIKEFQNYINSLVEEGAMILFNKKIGLKEEKNWLKGKLKKIKNRSEITLVAEYGGEIIGSAGIELRMGRQKHVGELGISISKKYRGIGLGKKLMAEILKSAKKELKPKPKIIRLSVYGPNKVAQNLYKKLGFRKAAKIPKQIEYKRKLGDEIIMLKEL